MVRQLPLLAVVFFGFLYWLGGYMKDVLYSANRQIARHSSLMAAYAVQSSMLAEGSHRVWDEFMGKIPRDAAADIEIVGARGRVLYASDAARRGKRHQITDRVCAACHKKGSPQATKQTAFLRVGSKKKTEVFAASLRNTRTCRKCHAKDGPKLGTVLVSRSLAPIHGHIWRAIAGLFIAGGIALLLTILTTRFLLNRYLGRPLKELVDGARAIGDGKFDRRVELPERSELVLLADALNASAAHLSQLQRELVEQERLVAIGETMAGLSHCLKNILNGLRAGQYVIDRGWEKGDREKVVTGWRVMKQAIQRIERLTLDMIYYAKERDLRLEVTDLNEVVCEVADLLRETAGARGVEIRTELSEEVGCELLDRTCIYRVVLNLTTNAVDACTEAGSDRLVVLRTRSEPNEIILEVEDNGFGMDEKVSENVFNRFFSTKASKGTGLGLSVVKEIVERHCGKVVVKSEPGKGSIFQVRLPGCAQADSEPMSTGSQAVGAAVPYRVAREDE